MLMSRLAAQLIGLSGRVAQASLWVLYALFSRTGSFFLKLYRSITNSRPTSPRPLKKLPASSAPPSSSSQPTPHPLHHDGPMHDHHHRLDNVDDRDHSADNRDLHDHGSPDNGAPLNPLIPSSHDTSPTIQGGSNNQPSPPPTSDAHNVSRGTFQVSLGNGLGKPPTKLRLTPTTSASQSNDKPQREREEVAMPPKSKEAKGNTTRSVTFVDNH